MSDGAKAWGEFKQTKQAAKIWAHLNRGWDISAMRQLFVLAYETGFGEGLLEGFESGKQEGRDRAAEIILAGAQHYDDVTRGILARFAREIRQQESTEREGSRNSDNK